MMYYNYNEAKRAEKESKWRKAASIWAYIGYHKDANTCNYIADAIEAGDRFRKLSSRIRFLLHDGQISEKEYHTKLDELYKNRELWALPPGKQE